MIISRAVLRMKEGLDKVLGAVKTHILYPITPPPPNLAVHEVKDKGKAIPLQAWTGPESSRRLRFPDFKTLGTGMW
jgi:hypothetical protein